MHLRFYRFDELEGKLREWSVGKFHLDKVNLFVGVNSSGKSRIINTIDVLGKLISKSTKVVFEAARWSVLFEHEGDLYDLYIEIKDKIIVSERLTVDGKVRILRKPDGKGFLWFQELGQYVDVQAKPDDLLIASRQDELQHPYLLPLTTWASRVRLYPFSSDLGRRQLWLYRNLANKETASENVPNAVIDPSNVVEQYVQGFDLYGDTFDQKILEDFRSIGYDCTEISAEPFEGIEELENTGRLPIQLTAKESALDTATRQIDMSTGMFRALSMIIHVNFMVFSNIKSTILIDDIGEGLDYERAASLVRLLIERCNESDIQIIMTSNDRFVMNAVDLEYWHLISRDKSRVTVQDKHNSEKEFDTFRYLGLSNFDFFKSQVGH